MNNLADIIQKRRTPGVLILDETGKLLFMNAEVNGVLPIIAHAVDDGPSLMAAALPEEIRNVCAGLINPGAQNGKVRPPVACSFFFTEEGRPFSLRAFPVGAVTPDAHATHIMVLVEPVIDQHQIDFAAVQERYGLSKREAEVLKVLCQGMSNRQIADRLFISEHTAKDHVKRIFQAMGVASRAEIIAALSR